MQMEILMQALAKEVEIEKVMIFFFSEDVRRLRFVRVASRLE